MTYITHNDVVHLTTLIRSQSSRKGATYDRQR
jgi:hypothetical protein